jgi:hypothetical protein
MASVFVNSPGIGFDAFYCMPGLDGAHEKGGVEGEVGRFRRTHLSPMPAVDSLAELAVSEEPPLTIAPIVPMPQQSRTIAPNTTRSVAPVDMPFLRGIGTCAGWTGGGHAGGGPGGTGG